MNSRKGGVIEIDDSFYESYRDVTLRLGEAEHNLVFFTEALPVLEKKLMYRSDEAFYTEFKKRLPEYLQRREAKSNPAYIQAVRAKARSQEAKVALRGEQDILKMKFDEWRTRSVDRRNSI
jgi:hypothetical protein